MNAKKFVLLALLLMAGLVQAQASIDSLSVDGSAIVSGTISINVSISDGPAQLSLKVLDAVTNSLEADLSPGGAVSNVSETFTPTEEGSYKVVAKIIGDEKTEFFSVVPEMGTAIPETGFLAVLLVALGVLFAAKAKD